ncbi:MAG: HAMP domain-containing sensor histidine kinase, partial [Verrucomicrobiota bacterium]
LRDQQFVLERQRALLYQNIADSLAKDVTVFLSDRQREFAAQVETYLNTKQPTRVSADFDPFIRQQWPLAEVGFGVSFSEGLGCPSPDAGSAARMFCTDNGDFLANRQVAEVYWNTLNGNLATDNNASGRNVSSLNNVVGNNNDSNVFQTKQQSRKVWVAEQQAAGPGQQLNSIPNQQAQMFANVSKVAPADAEFRLLVGDGTDGMLARFVQNKLRLLFWHRQHATSDPIYGAQVNLAQLVTQLQQLIAVEPTLREEICVALLDDNTRPRYRTDEHFQTDWKRPFVAAEVGEALPHWELAVYLRHPARLGETARATAATLGLLIALLVLAIAVGSWLIVRDLNRQLTLARQKTDFVSNVSHELKTPLTSIRMFSELLAEGRVNEPEKQRSYLNIITAETARLTRLINNVLDFARMERGEKNYNVAACDLAALTRETVENFRPHWESAGIRFETVIPDQPVPMRADRDAVSQIIVNLLSNAEKYSNGAKEIRLELESGATAVELRVLDRGPGVPRGCEEKIFEKFYRANDSLTNNVPGSGLGLTLARQIARAHGGDVIYQPREGGGSCFILKLPLISSDGEGIP